MKIRIASFFKDSDTVYNGDIVINNEDKLLLLTPEGKKDNKFKYDNLLYVSFDGDELNLTIDDKSAMRIQEYYTK